LPLPGDDPASYAAYEMRREELSMVKTGSQREAGGSALWDMPVKSTTSKSKAQGGDLEKSAVGVEGQVDTEKSMPEGQVDTEKSMPEKLKEALGETSAPLAICQAPLVGDADKEGANMDYDTEAVELSSMLGCPLQEVVTTHKP